MLDVASAVAVGVGGGGEMVIVLIESESPLLGGFCIVISLSSVSAESRITSSLLGWPIVD